MTQTFKVGDRVSWLGIKAEVTESDHMYVRVEYTDNDGDEQTAFFQPNGVYINGQRPSLKLLKKSPRFRKRVGYYAVIRAVSVLSWVQHDLYESAAAALKVKGAIGFRKVIWWEKK